MSAGAPTARALLLTDVVDSTKLSEQLGDAAMAKVWAAHDRVARDLLRVHRGREIDKTDGFLLLFDAAPDAVAYAVAYHRAIAALDPPLQARAGLHVGPVILTVNAAADVALGAKPLEVDGLAKPTAARVMSLAVGGQTLLTAEARAALGATELRVESHGHWRMKGVAEPVALFEVGGAEAPFTPPPDGAKVYRVVRQGELWLPVKQVAHNLATARDAFVGREADLQDLSRRLDDGARLVTVLGIGGTGKTRLVAHYAWTWLGSWPGGAWFCDLSEARSVEGIASAVATALDVPLGRGDPIAQLGHAIAGRGRCLVVLDNFEQVARHAPETLGRWLDRASDASFVVTSREFLGLRGESALPLAPLREDDATALFVARAVQASGHFALSEADRPHVRALVTLLDGLPLAIELAAARVRVMPPKTLLERMSQRFKLLSSSGGRHTRQATLRATLDWSWDLLSPDEQSALAQVSVFEGGFTLEAAEAVLALDETWPVDAVQGLVDKSLVRRVSEDRLDLLVSVQEYASEKLAQGRSVAEERHSAFFAGYGTDALPALDVHGGVERRRALVAELDNLVAGLRRAVGRGDGEVAAALLSAAWAVLELRGPFVLAADLAQAVLAVPALPDAARGGALRVLARALHGSGRVDEARPRYAAALALFRALGDRRQEGWVRNNLGILHFELGEMDEARAHAQAALALYREAGTRGDVGGVLCNLGTEALRQGRMDEARAHCDAALVALREVGHRRFEGNVRHCLGNLHLAQGRMDEARAHYDAALAIHREGGHRHQESHAHGSLGNLHFVQGRMDEARAHYDAAIAVAREVGDRRQEALCLANLGNLHLEQGRPDEGRACCDAALPIAREVGNRHTEGIALTNLGKLHVEQGRPDEGRAQYELGLAAAQEVGDRLFEGGVLHLLGDLHLDQGRADEARAAFTRAEAVLRPLGGVELGALLCARARLERAEGDPEAARARLTEAVAIARYVGTGPDSALGRELAKATGS